MKALVVLASLFLLTSGQAVAQTRPYRGEVFAGAGGARVGGDEGSLGSGPCIVVGLGFRFTTRASVELDLLRAQHDRDIAGGPLEGTATGVFGEIVYHFSEGRVQVFVVGSAGLLNSKTTHRYPAGGSAIVFRSHNNDLAWGGGGGVKIFLAPHLSLRPQLRLVFSEATGVMGLTAASVAVGYHW